MHLLPPQVELDVTCLILTLATLAIAWLTCSLPTRDAGLRTRPCDRGRLARAERSASLVMHIHAETGKVLVRC
jgi:hypothetical protein